MLTVLGIDPKRITCEVGEDGVSRVYLGGVLTAWLGDHGTGFEGNWLSDDFRRDAQAVMNAAIDEWRASGGKRLWPESPPPEPVDCVCGAKVRDYEDAVYCERGCCSLTANNVIEWNAIQAALKKMKESTS